MKKRNIFYVALLSTAMQAWAQDPVHGVDGYYNWTPTQLKASGLFSEGGNGKKVTGWYPEVGYTDDMDYVRFTMGINNATKETNKGGFNFRSEMTLKESATGAGIMTITRAYPVIAMKISVPLNDEASEEVKIADGYFEPEFKWYNPGTGASEKLPVNGLDANGRYRFLQYGGPLKDMLGRDSVQLNRGNNGYDNYRTAKAVHTEYNDSIWHLVRLNPEAGDKADFLLAMDLSTICAEAKEGGGTLCLDTTDIKLSNFSLGFLGVYADTLAYEIEDGDTISSRVKTKEEMPTVYLKWIKTFSSMKDFDESLTAENNWGDGEVVDPQKGVLNSSMYDVQQFIANYKFSDQLAVLEEAYSAAKAVYDNPDSKSEDFTAQIEALAGAKKDFLTAIAYHTESLMNTFVNYSGMALGLETVDKTIGNYTGKLMTTVSPENAVAFMLVDNGEVGGQKAYNLKTASGTIVQATDGSLMLVDASQLTGSNAANVVLANRGTVDEPGYDFKVGNYYYYFDDMENRLSVAEEIPTVETKDEIANYLFFPTPAEYDPSDHDAENYPMSSGEGSAWEFNGTVEMALEPAYKASFEKYPWADGAKKVATERATLPYVEGWSTNGWRMGTNLAIDNTIEDGEGKAMSCLKLNWMDKYDDIHADSVNVAEKVTDWSEEGGQTVSIMREHGFYNSALNRVPQPNQQCDSLYAINLNSGINRYFAMKWKSNNPNVTFNGFTFYVRKSVEEPAANMDNLLEKRGDVYIWDLLECGVPFGDRKACAQYVSWVGMQSADDAVYVDWIRFYDSLDAIPTETIATAIEDTEMESQTMVTVNGNNVRVMANGEVCVYSVDGRLVASASAEGQVSFTLANGMYVVKAVEGKQITLKKIVVR